MPNTQEQQREMNASEDKSYYGIAKAFDVIIQQASSSHSNNCYLKSKAALAK